MIASLLLVLLGFGTGCIAGAIWAFERRARAGAPWPDLPTDTREPWGL